ncbi:MAG TPA: exodeoxyribonuclease VII large subunit [Acidimicrobiales bacterium]|nr:exodeoxyribonuclease VII large subunit [Acidimicrobiales bacterium]
MSQPTLDLELDDAGEPTYTVGELAEAINGALRSRFGYGVWVRGEIAGFRDSGPHSYFELCESTTEGKARLAVSWFGFHRNKLRPHLHRHRLWPLRDGLTVRIYGDLDFFPGSGRLTLKMTGIDPRFTLGELALQRDDTVRRLVAEGLYDAQRRLVLAPVPLRVGVVTSVGSAAWHDLTHELEQSGLGFRLGVVDTRVQGEWAVDGVTAALRTLARRDVDVIVLVRGGGARSELATFDAEPIARAIATSPIPVITGLGHEVDRTVADDVAHLALKTPTACAATLVQRVDAYREQSEEAWTRITSKARDAVDHAQRLLTVNAHRAAARTRSAVELAAERIDHQHHRLPVVARRTLAAGEDRLHRGEQRVARRAPQLLDGDARHLDHVEARVRALDPVHALARGWSITRTGDGHLVRRPADVAAGDELVTTLAAGTLRSRVEEESSP